MFIAVLAIMLLGEEILGEERRLVLKLEVIQVGPSAYNIRSDVGVVIIISSIYVVR